MKERKATIVRTGCGKAFDLRRTAPLASNIAAPFGPHNFIVFKTGNGFFLKGFNSGCTSQMLDKYDLISRNEAMHYFQAQPGNTQQISQAQ